MAGESVWRYSGYGFSKIRGPKYKPLTAIVLIIGTPQKGTPNFGKSPRCEEREIPGVGCLIDLCRDLEWWT